MERVAALKQSKEQWSNLGGFVGAMKAGDPLATFVSQLLPLPFVAPLLFFLASREGRALHLALSWGVGVIILQIIWFKYLLRDEVPKPALVQCFISGTVTLTTYVLPILWLPVASLVMMNLALVAAAAHRRATAFHLACAALVGLNGIEFASDDLIDVRIFVVMLPILVGTAVSTVTSHVVWQERNVNASLAAAGATAWDIDNNGLILAVLGTKVAGIDSGVQLLDRLHPEDQRSTDIQPGSVLEYRVSDGDAGWVWLRETVQAGVTAGAVIRSGIVDITASRKSAAFTERLARTDQLTEQPNRPAHVEESNLWASNGRGHLALIDLDGFKRVNDSVGHAVGDRVLQIVAGRFAAVEGVVHLARLGGDEFAALIDTEPQTVASRIVACTEEALSIDGLIVSVGTSVGLADFDGRCQADEVRRRADVALASAKQNSQRFVAYDATLESTNQRRLNLAKRLPFAFSSGEIIVYHQPKIDVATRAVIGTEALVRWRHPDEGIVMPADFLDLVALGGHIKTLTQSVLRAALADLSSIHQAGLDWTVAVNIDGRNFREPDFASRVIAEVEFAGFSSRHLVLELTEQALVEEDPVVEQTLIELDSAGFRLSVDDFGTGFSSLAYLGRLPVTEIKMDRALVSRICVSERDRAIVESTLRLAAELGMNVVAEGIEDEQTLDELEKLGCPMAQGFYIARPVAFDSLLSSNLVPSDATLPQ